MPDGCHPGGRESPAARSETARGAVEAPPEAGDPMLPRGRTAIDTRGLLGTDLHLAQRFRGGAPGAGRTGPSCRHLTEIEAAQQPERRRPGDADEQSDASSGAARPTNIEHIHDLRVLLPRPPPQAPMSSAFLLRLPWSVEPVKGRSRRECQSHHAASPTVRLVPGGEGERQPDVGRELKTVDRGAGYPPPGDRA